MNTRFYHARILTMEENRAVFHGELWVKAERIIFVGETEEAERYRREHPDETLSFDREIDCEDNLLMPGFKNAHTHSGMTLFRSLADDLVLEEWLEQKIFPAEAKLTDEDIYEGVRLAVLEYISGGITAVMDMYLSPETTARACMDMGMRCVLNGPVNNFCQSVQKMEEDYCLMNKLHPLISYRLGFHAEYTCTKQLLEEVSALSHKYHAPVFSHLAETAKETEECQKRYGLTPAAFLDSIGMYDYGGGGYHGVYMSQEEIALFRRKGLYVVSNPGSNTKLASGIAPISDYLKAGVRVAVGTDGAASNNCLDMFREMFLLTGLAKLKTGDATAVPAEEVLKMATVNGAGAMGLTDCDVLAEGKLADLIRLDMRTPNMQPENNIVKNIVYSGCKENVTMTMIHGRILYEDGKYNVTTNTDTIYQNVNKIIGRIR